MLIPMGERQGEGRNLVSTEARVRMVERKARTNRGKFRSSGSAFHRELGALRPKSGFSFVGYFSVSLCGRLVETPPTFFSFYLLRDR